MEHRVLIQRDERGAIEGLPLQLMIAVIVAGIALAIILGWVLSIPAPNVISRIETSPETVRVDAPPHEAGTTTVTITVRAFDQKGNAISGIAVTLSGASVTDTNLDVDDGARDGTVTFSNVEVTLPANVATLRIDVTVEASGFPSGTAHILVARQ